MAQTRQHSQYLTASLRQGTIRQDAAAGPAICGVPLPAHTAQGDGMKNSNASKRPTARRMLAACSTALAAAFTVVLSGPAHAARITPPAVPFGIEVEEGNTPFLEGHGVGTQNYICL